MCWVSWKDRLRTLGSTRWRERLHRFPPCLCGLVEEKLRATARLQVAPVLSKCFDLSASTTLWFSKQNQEGRETPSLCDAPCLTDSGYVPFSSSIQMNPADGENFASMVELMFVFSMIWSVCAAVDEEGRKRIDSCLREMEGSFPNKVRAPSPGSFPNKVRAPSPGVPSCAFSRTHLRP